MYSQPARAMRRRAQDRQYAAELASFYGDGEATLIRAVSYLEREFCRACTTRDLVRREGIKGALAVLNAARIRVLTEVEKCPF